jgi:hypothetical protein
VSARASDYEWASVWRAWAETGYCLTIVKDLQAAEVLQRLNAFDRVGGLTLDDVQDRCWDAWHQLDDRSLVVGATFLFGSTVLVEVNGFVGVTVEVALPVSKGTQLVSHYRNVNAVGRFVWIVDEEVRLEFDPLFPSERSGASVGEAELLMRRAGFSLDEGSEPSANAVPSAFALGEAITGVEIDPNALMSARYTSGLVTLPH